MCLTLALLPVLPLLLLQNHTVTKAKLFPQKTNQIRGLVNKHVV